MGWQVSLSWWNSHVWSLNSSHSWTCKHLLQVSASLPGSSVHWLGNFLWIYHVRHSSYNQKGPQWRQGFHCSLSGSLHRLVQIFRKVLIILMQKDERDNK